MHDIMSSFAHDEHMAYSYIKFFKSKIHTFSKILGQLLLNIYCQDFCTRWTTNCAKHRHTH